MSSVNTSRRRRFAGLGVAAAMAIALVSAAPSPAAAAEGRLLGTGNPNAIADSYIVIFKDGAAPGTKAQSLTSRLSSTYGAKVEHTYSHALRGFAGTMSRAAARRLAARPEVAYVEQNGTVQIQATQTNPPSWGLDRIDQRNLPLNSSYSYSTAASNVRAYVIDTGIRVTHTTFGGRATWGTNTTGDGINSDCHGHGTHVAGTIGGAQYGVAKGVALTAVKVLNCAGSGTWAAVAAGVDWVTSHHTAGAPAVANMSLSTAANTTIDDAVRNSIADGIVYVIGSGNNNSDACNYSPARVTEAITVNASASTDARASFSNFGTCTDIFAPGVAITSAGNGSDTAADIMSGTSMATPHVAGAAALVLSPSPSLSPAQVANAIFANATPNKITNPGAGSPNRLLYTIASTPPSAQVPLYRHTSGADHISSTSTAISGFTLEGSLGQIKTSQVSGTGPLYQCLVGGTDYMSSNNSACEGQAVVGVIGYVYASPPASPYRTLFRCRMGLDHFDSVAANCEGQIVEGVLGYLLQ